MYAGNYNHKIVSGDVKCRKPDKRIYELTLEQTGKSPAECVFIDNSVKNLEVADDLGIRTILYNR
ncbi:MAG: HAD-IA family hydrolase, partial [Lachnospiraceae bacterium]|nr:HAD-IA family hydrolase [Lachnospiraceae bacterium]